MPEKARSPPSKLATTNPEMGRGWADRDHVPRALERAAHLVRSVADRPAHLPRELFGDRVASRFELLAEPRQHRDPRREWRRAPMRLCDAGECQCGIDLERTCELALDIDAAVDRGACLLEAHSTRLLIVVR